MIKVGNLFKLFYIVLLFLFIDSRFTVPVFNGYYKWFSYVFITFFGICIIAELLINKKIKISPQSKSLNIAGLIILYFIIFIFTSQFSVMVNKVYGEIFNWVLFLLNMFVTYYWIKRFHFEKFFILTTFFVSALVIVYAFISNGAPLYVLFRLDKVFSNVDRYRLNFGYYHVNGLGNLCTFAIIFSVFSFIQIKKIFLKRNIIRRALFSIIVILDIFVLIVLLSTASRNSILCLLIFAILCLYFFFTNTKYLTKKAKTFTRICIIVALMSIVVFQLSETSETIVQLFVDSNRMKNYLVNIPVLIDNNGLLFGLGLFNPGLFGTGETLFYNTYFIDNYYLYVIMETGIIGILLIAIILYKTGHQLFLKYKNSKNAFTIVVFSCFIAQIINGMGETSLFFYSFPSCLGYWILFLLTISDTIMYE